MALEPSEVFCAAALCFNKTYLQNKLKLVGPQGPGSPNDRIDRFLTFFKEAEKVASGNEVVFAENKQAFLNFFKDPLKNPGNIIDMSRGISAAIAVQEWMQSEHKVKNTTAHRVFMTGNVWPKEVKPLAVKAHGFDAYNSSDLIIRPVGMPNAYFGVSLKKKPKPNDQDPTLINKAFDTVLTDKSFDIVKKELEDIREKYFAGLVKEAVKEGYIKLDITGKTDAQLFKPDKKTRNSEGFERIYIDTKGSMKMPEIYGPKDTDIEAKWGTAKESRFNYYGDKALGRSELSSRNDTMRAWVNKKLGETNCPLYKAFLKVMNDNSEVFAKNLINVTLKTDLPNQMKSKDLGNMTFGFALVTGIGDGTKGKKLLESATSTITVYKGKAYDIHSILCGLSDLDSNTNDYKFKITNRMESDNDDGSAEGGAAKIYFDLIKNRVPLMNMELRYKGGFGGQPQFFGTLTKQFKTIIEDKCLVKGKDGAR
jgi:hypothetical protein|tara:strand:+ start:76 stop:1518 length:1443 start_codon:yes stop_codon:yes gene_type:complete